MTIEMAAAVVPAEELCDSSVEFAGTTVPARRSAQATVSMTWPDYLARRCWTDRPVRLTPWETEALSVLLIRRGQPVPSGELCAIPTPRCRDGLRSQSSLRAMISGLNAKLGGLIRSDRRGAYSIAAPSGGRGAGSPYLG